MGNITSCCESCLRSRKSHSYEPLLLEDEREAVADLSRFLKNRTNTNFFLGTPLAALTTLSFSDNVDLQRRAAIALAEITKKEVQPVDRETLDPILFLLSSHDTEVQCAAGAALANLAVNTDNKLLIVKLGGLEPLIRQMLSLNAKVQCSAAGCVMSLAAHDANKTSIAKSGALAPLIRLAHSKNVRVQCKAIGALFRMTHSDESRQQVVNAGAIPVLVELLISPYTDVQHRCTAALRKISIDCVNRKELAQSEPRLVQNVVLLLDSSCPKVQCQAVLVLCNLAYDENYQLEVVKADGLTPLLRLLQSRHLPLVLSAAKCLSRVSVHPKNEYPIIEAGFLQPSIDLLAFKGNEEAQLRAISTLRNLAFHSEESKWAVFKAGAVQSIKELVLEVPMNVQSRMAACISELAYSDKLQGRLLETGICEVLIPLTNSQNSEVQCYSAAALGILSSGDGLPASDDYSAFNEVWDGPEGGMHDFLYRFLTCPDAISQYLAVWTIIQLLESSNPQLIANIRSSPLLSSHIRQLATSCNSTPSASVGTPHSLLSHLNPEIDMAKIQGDIQLFSRGILEFIEGDSDLL